MQLWLYIDHMLINFQFELTYIWFPLGHNKLWGEPKIIIEQQSARPLGQQSWVSFEYVYWIIVMIEMGE